MMRLDDTPEGIISRLDAALERRKLTVTLQRITIGPGAAQIPFSVECPASVRDYKAQELIGGIIQGDSEVIISPTPIIAGQWTSGATGAVDNRVPIKGNRVIIAGRPRSVLAVDPTYVGETLVRIAMTVRG